MKHELSLRVTPAVAAKPELLEEVIFTKTGINKDVLGLWRVKSRSVDARSKRVMVNLAIEIMDKGESFIQEDMPVYNALPADAPHVNIVGAGPAGLFAALRAIELGWCPIVFERGKDVDNRRKDLAQIARNDAVDPESNYCFGEGGAGTFSDGKLYTRSKKRGSVKDILMALHVHGANPEILVDAHPHIGTDKLPGIIKSIRETIVNAGGKVNFSTRIDSLLIKGNVVEGVVTSAGDKYEGPVILATGHSARDVYRMLDREGVDIEPKGIAIGVRLEHPQETIDRIQYHNPAGRGRWLPPAEYSFVCQVDGRGVYSFCMCPGGVIVPSATGPCQSVVNGMSSSSRGSRFANSGMVVEIHPEDFPEFEKYGNLRMLHLQESLESNFYQASGNSLNAPAQRMLDFVKGKISIDLPATSYPPGIHSAPVHFLLPDFISSRLRKGFEVFGKKAKGFLTNDATVIGLESRTSSPVRIPRKEDEMCHVRIANLYPAGEGAGYAGGIVSAAIDGRRCMDALNDAFRKNCEPDNIEK